MSGLVRIRLNFQHSVSVPEASNCWFLVDTSTCRTISDLEYLIKKRFRVSSTKNAVMSLNLFLDDYLLPSQEKIEIIQPNDNIRVDLKQIRTKQFIEEDESVQDSESTVKRKSENGSLSDVRIETRKNSVKKSSLSAVAKSKSSKTSERRGHKHLKSEHKPSHRSQKLVSTTKPCKRKSNVEISKTNAKKSKTNNKLIESDLVVDQNGLDSSSSSSESSSSTESAVACTSKKESNFATSKPNAEKTTTMHHKAKGFVGTKTASDGGSKSYESSSFTESLSDLSHKSGPLEKHRPKSATILNGVKSLESKTSKQHRNCDKSQSHKGQGKYVQKKFQSEVAKQKVKGERAANGIAAKSSTALQGKKQVKFTASAKVSSSSSSSTDSSESEDSEAKTGKCIGQETQLSSSSSSLSPSPLPSLPPSLSSSSSLSSSHSSTFYPTSSNVDDKLNVKVDNTHEEKSEDASKNVYPSSSTSTQSSILPSSSSNSSKEDKEATIMTGDTHNKVDRCSNMDPVLPSSVAFSSYGVMKGSSNTAWPGLSTSKSSTGWKATQQQGSSLSLKSHIRFDSEDETSEGQGSRLINDSTDVFDETRLYTVTPEGTCEQRNKTSSTKALEQTEPAQRDYTRCTPLHGPPRANDKIAYKVLELSASYTPEVSNYKEGTVLSYDSITGAVTIDLTKESLKKTPGDGNITRKFELIYDNEGCNADNEEVDRRVTVPWSSMLEPVLLSN